MLFYFPSISRVLTFEQVRNLNFKYITVESNFKRNEYIKNDEIFNLLKNNKFWIIVSLNPLITSGNINNEFCKNLITNLHETTKYTYIKNMETNEEYYNSDIEQSIIDFQKFNINQLLNYFN
tara:strand:+ start:223 stop:588 length:366 start_codon:yes stop_codon:yes gene_type:complete